MSQSRENCESPIIRSNVSKWKVTSDNEEEKETNSSSAATSGVRGGAAKKQEKYHFCIMTMCNRKFSKWKDLFNHMTTHECGVNVFACFKCSVGFLSFNALLEHERRRHVTSKYATTGCRAMLDVVAHVIVCSKCGVHVPIIENAFGMVKLNYETLRAHPSGKFRKLSFYTWTKSSKEYLGKCATPKVAHIRIQFAPNLSGIPLKCRFCDENFLAYADWQRIEDHTADEHRDVAKPKSCALCDNVFFTEFAYDLHAQQSHTSEKWFLTEFLATFPNSSPFEPSVVKPSDRLKCDLCLALFSLSDFNKHDCAINYTRRIECDGFVYKCPSVALDEISVDTTKIGAPLIQSLGEQFRKYAIVTLEYDKYLATETLTEMKLKEYAACRSCEVVAESVGKLCRHYESLHRIPDLNKLNKQQAVETYCDLVPVSIEGMLCPKDDCRAVFCSANAVEWHLKIAHFDTFLNASTLQLSTSLTPVPDDPAELKVSRMRVTGGISNLQNIHMSYPTHRKIRLSIRDANTSVSSIDSSRSSKKSKKTSDAKCSKKKIPPTPATPTNHIDQSSIVLIHPPPVAGMKPGIYSFVISKENTVPSGTFINGDPGSESYYVAGDTVLTFMKLSTNGTAKFCIGCIPENYTLPAQNANKFTLPTVRAPQWECPICSLKSANVLYLRRHLKDKHCYLCQNCMQCFVTFEQRNKHVRSCTAVSTIDEVRAPITCSKCDGVHSTWKEYFGHLFDLHQSDIRFDANTGRIFPLLGDSDDAATCAATVDNISGVNDNAVISNSVVGDVIENVRREKRKGENRNSNGDGSAPKRLALDSDEAVDTGSAFVTPENTVTVKCVGFETLAIENVRSVKSSTDNSATKNITPSVPGVAMSTFEPTFEISESIVSSSVPETEVISDPVIFSTLTSFGDTPLDIELVDTDSQLSTSAALPEEVYEKNTENNENDNSGVGQSESAPSPVKGTDMLSVNGFSGGHTEDDNVPSSSTDKPPVETSVPTLQHPLTSAAEICFDDDVVIESVKEGVQEVKSETCKTPVPNNYVDDDDIEIISAPDDAIPGTSSSTSVDRKTHNCTMCSKMFQTVRSLNDHMKVGHVYDAGATTDLVLAVPVNSDVYVCRLCCLAYENRETFERHIKKHGTILACSQCTAVSLAMDYLQNHAHAHDTPKLVFGCPVCRQAYRKESNLLLHMNGEHGVALLWNCQKCSKANTDWSKMASHFGLDHKADSSNNSITSLILPCAQSKLHYQPDKPELYKSSDMNPNIVVGECTHRTFLAYSETLVGCSKCGSMIPATKFLLENESVRRDGQFKLFLADETLEKTVESCHPYYIMKMHQQQSRVVYVNGTQQQAMTSSSSPTVRQMLNDRPTVFGSRIRPTLTRAPVSTTTHAFVASSVTMATARGSVPSQIYRLTVPPPSAALVDNTLLPQLSGPVMTSSAVATTSTAAPPSPQPNTAASLQQQVRPAISKCNICHLAYNSLAALKVHMIKHDTVSVIFCLECGFSSKTSCAFYAHINDIHGTKVRQTISSVCQHCGERIAGLDSFFQHNHPGVSRCSVCRMPSYAFDDVDSHTRKHALYGIFCCPFCTACFASQREMDIHKLRHCCESWVMCRDCGMCYKSWDQMERHFINAHWGNQSSLPECQACSEPMNRTPQFHLLVRHTVLAVRLKQAIELTISRPQIIDLTIIDQTKFAEMYVCQFCHWFNMSPFEARQHAGAHQMPGNLWTVLASTSLLCNAPADRHDTVASATSSARCTYCSTSSSLKQLINEHLHLIHPECGRYLCNMCDEQFDTKADRYYHEIFNHLRGSNKPLAIASQNDPSPLYCPLCGLNVADALFIKHLSSHVLSAGSSGCVVLKMCAMCGLCFANRPDAALTDHVLSHGRRSKDGHVMYTSPQESALMQRRLFFVLRCADGPVTGIDSPVCDLCDEILPWNAPTIVKHFVQHFALHREDILKYHSSHCSGFAFAGVTCRMCAYLRLIDA